MKKIISRIFLGLLILVILAAVAVHLFLDSAVKRGVETIGPSVTKVPIKLNSISISLLSGSGKVKGLTVGNPEGYKTPSSIQVGSASLELSPGSIFSPKVVIKSIVVEGPEITFETDFKGNNLSKILDNVQKSSGTSTNEPSKPAQPAEPAANQGKKLEVDDFVIKGAKMHVSVTTLNQSATVPLPDIHLTNLGTGPEGITPAELTERVLSEIEKVAVQQSASVMGDISKGAQFMARDVQSNVVNKVTKGIGDLFKKK
ncbi:MAG TPA: AsmA family protein [Candidatus Dormibacteraeota bacterium]|nr:AsmA family protein [Candidatus Dormibacteraeota bacterium]